MRAKAFLRVLIMAGALSSCGDDAATGADGGGDPVDTSSLFGASVTEIALEIDYESGAEPYTGDSVIFGDPWNLFVTNAQDLFSESPKTLSVPTTLDGMEALDDLGGPDFDTDAILAIADEHRDDADTDSRRVFYVLFLDGFFADSSGRRSDVLGVSIGDTGVIAMFKSVIDATGLPRQVEQVTLVHEFGHAVGLVNNGLAMVDPHQDSEHGAHCNNPDCVMYWAVAGSDVMGYVRDRVLSSSTSIFGTECLDDAHAAATSP